MIHMTMLGGNPLKKISKDLNDFTIDEIAQVMENPRLAKMIMETTLTDSMTFFLQDGNVVKYEYNRKEKQVYKRIGKIKNINMESGAKRFTERVPLERI